MATQELTFDQMNLDPGILQGVRDAGFVTPSPIQKASIPLILTGADLIGQAQTGTGKTAAYGLPTMSRLKNNKTVEILVLTPTRELAIQVSDELFRLGKFANVKTVPVVGGQGYLRQVELINRGAQVVVATPGRLMDHLREGRLKRFCPQTVILDEADEMLDRGFVDDIRQILSQLPQERQTLLFSATMPPEIKALTREFMRQPHHVQLNSGQQTNVDIEQRLVVIRAHEREAALVRILEVEDPEKAIIFCRTKRDVDALQQELTTRGVAAKSIHGDMSQALRNQAVQALKEGRAKIIIATDVAARGLDIPNVTHVINFHVPENRERYVHRIGRTGRAGNCGVSITVATASEIRGNDVFSKAHVSEFVVGEVPSKSAVRACLELQLSAKIDGLRIRSDFDKLVQDIVGKYSSEELAQRLVSLVAAGRHVIGEDRIGLAIDEGRRILNASGPRGRISPREGRGRFGGGSARNGSYVNRGSKSFKERSNNRWDSGRSTKTKGKWSNKSSKSEQKSVEF